MRKMSRRPPFVLVLLLGVLFSSIWSSAFVAGKVALQYANPISLLVFRFATAAAIILCTSVLAKRVWLFDYRVIGHGAALGALNNAVYLGLTFRGLEYISPALTTLIVSTAPFLTLAFCYLFFKERISLSQISGVVLGFLGVFSIIRQHSLSGSDMGIGLTFLGTASFALGTVYYRWVGDAYSAPQLNGWQNLFGALFLLPFASHVDVMMNSLGDGIFDLALVHLTIIASIGAMLLWFYLIRSIGASHASAFHFLVPIFGMLQSAIIFGDRITMPDVLGILTVSISLMLVNRPSAMTRGKRPSCSPEPNQMRTVPTQHRLYKAAIVAGGCTDVAQLAEKLPLPVDVDGASSRNDPRQQVNDGLHL
jgi:drug/metabolite transporter (DMT)-like permease